MNVKDKFRFSAFWGGRQVPTWLLIQSGDVWVFQCWFNSQHWKFSWRLIIFLSWYDIRSLILLVYQWPVQWKASGFHQAYSPKVLQQTSVLWYVSLITVRLAATTVRDQIPKYIQSASQDVDIGEKCMRLIPLIDLQLRSTLTSSR